MRVDDGVRALTGNVRNSLERVIGLDNRAQRDTGSTMLETYALEARHVGRVVRASEATGGEALNHEGNTESIEALANKVLPR